MKEIQIPEGKNGTMIVLQSDEPAKVKLNNLAEGECWAIFEDPSDYIKGIITPDGFVPVVSSGVWLVRDFDPEKESKRQKSLEKYLEKIKRLVCT